MGGPQKAPVYRYDGSGIGKKKECVENANKEIDFNYVLMSPKCTYDFNNKKFSGKFIDNDFTLFDKYLTEVSNKTGKYEKGGHFYVSKKSQINLSKSLEKALLNLSQSREKRGLPIPSRRVFLDVFEQEHLYELNLRDNKVERHAKTDGLGDNTRSSE